MKALFSKNTRNAYPDHLQPDFEPPYLKKDSAQYNTTTDSRMNVSQLERAPRQANSDYGRARTTLGALQIIRRRFEDAKTVAEQESVQTDQAAA